MDRRGLRRQFLRRLGAELRVVWPILSALTLIMLALGPMVGLIEGWPLRDSLWFAIVTGLTIGYGDLVPKALLARALAAVIGIVGILVMALFAALAVNALGKVRDDDED